MAWASLIVCYRASWFRPHAVKADGAPARPVCSARSALGCRAASSVVDTGPTTDAPVGDVRVPVTCHVYSAVKNPRGFVSSFS